MRFKQYAKVGVAEAIALVAIVLLLTGATTVKFSPNKTNEEAVKEYIQQVKKTLDVAAYSLTNKEIGESIKAARSKAKVRVLCDKQQDRKSVV